MATASQIELFEALLAHSAELEVTRGAASDLELEALGRRIEAVRLLLEWLSQALEPQVPAFPVVQTPLRSDFPADQGRSPPCEHPSKTFRRPQSSGRKADQKRAQTDPPERRAQ